MKAKITQREPVGVIVADFIHQIRIFFKYREQGYLCGLDGSSIDWYVEIWFGSDMEMLYAIFSPCSRNWEK